jgi:hypothetical protein
MTILKGGSASDGGAGNFQAKQIYYRKIGNVVREEVITILIYSLIPNILIGNHIVMIICSTCFLLSIQTSSNLSLSANRYLRS